MNIGHLIKDAVRISNKRLCKVILQYSFLYFVENNNSDLNQEIFKNEGIK